MRKTVTMMMTILMLASVLATFDGYELEEVKIDESSGRAAEANITTVLSPRATVTDAMTGEKRGAILAGEDTEFDIVVLNEGDAPITEMNIVVTVYLTGGIIATDSAGNDLEWIDPVICDDLTTCMAESLNASSYLAGGAYTMQYFDTSSMSRENIAWTPIVGDYELVFELDIPEPSQDAIESNNALFVPVSVVDWYDIEVDLTWLDDDGYAVDESASGSDLKEFMLTVSLNGSSNWDARNITIGLTSSGDGMDTSFGEDGGDLSAGHSVMAGTLNATAVVWQDMSDDADINASDFQEFGPRYELSWGDTFTYMGNVSPDSSVASGTYKVVASLTSFKVFSQKPACAQEENMTIDNGPDGVEGTEDDIIDTVTVIHLCDLEESFADDVNANSDDEINGAVSNFHDIAVVDITVIQGYDEAGHNPVYMYKDLDTVSVGFSRILVEVTHRGSDFDEHYDWEVDVVVTDYNGDVAATYTGQDSCVNGMPGGLSYAHMPLGMPTVDVPADTVGFACPVHSFGNGEFTVTATVSMVNPPATGDMASSNDDETAQFVAFNNVPTVSMTLTTGGDIISGDTVSFSLNAFDADCPDGSCLTFNWSRMKADGTVDPMPMCDTDPAQPGSGWACADMAGPDWTGSNAVWVVASDDIGGESLPSYAFPKVWSDLVIERSSATVDMTYRLQTDMLSELDYTVTDMTQLTSVTLPGQVDTFSSTIALDYQPTLSFNPENVLTQSFSIVFEGDSSAAYTLWYQTGSTWGMLTDVVEPHNSTHVMMNHSAFGGGTLRAGTLAIFEGAEGGEAPTATISNFNAVAAGSGDVELTWEVAGQLTPIDNFKIYVDGVETASIDHDGDRVWRDKGLTHGISHSYVVKICNAFGCNPTEGSGSAAADNEVSPASGAGAVSFTENTTHVLVAWTATDTSDVMHWMVCHDTATFDANSVGLGQITCDMTTGTDLTHAIAKKTAAGTHSMFVSVGGMDNLGNSEENGQMGNTQYTNEQDLTIDTDEVIEGGGDSELPGWAWPAIIGVVVVAFIAGAFILSRGGEGEDGNKDWDY